MRKAYDIDHVPTVMTDNKSRAYLALLVLAALGVGLVYVRPVALAGVDYVGSSACASCHSDDQKSWKLSEHQRMMRPVEDPGVLVAEFDEQDRRLRFEREQAVWAIGGKWEQQFMGHDGSGETLLPGAWLVGSERWKLSGWDGWRKPVPRQRCHGCHTVGLNPETGEFVEANIGCESCHGPGSWHVKTWGLGRIESSADAQVCGQCHTRGSTPSGEYHFPVGYRPGGELAAHFEEVEPSPGQSSSAWWGNGFERKRHQEYGAWRRGGHADSLARLREGYDGRYGAVTDECLRCHAGDFILAAGGRRPGVGDAKLGVTCAVCHNVHGELDALRLECSACHEAGAFYHEPERNADHVACAAEGEVGCVGCHMPLVIKNGGAYTLHSHRPGVVPPHDTLRYGMPSSCANGGCHADAPTERLIALYEAHYGPPASEAAADSKAAEALPAVQQRSQAAALLHGPERKLP